jgi:PAS domain S-box-containing protein
MSPTDDRSAAPTGTPAPKLGSKDLTDGRDSDLRAENQRLRLRVAELEGNAAGRIGAEYVDRFMKSIVENVPAMIFVKDASTLRFVLLNKAEEQMLGKPREWIIGHSDHDLFSKKDADFFIGKDRSVLDSGELLDIPEEAVKTESGTFILHTKKIPLLDRNGVPKYLLGISEDITERKRAEELRAREGQVLKMLVAGGNLQELLAVSVRRIEEHVPDMLCSVLLLGPDGKHLFHGAAPSLPDEYNQRVAGLCIGPSAGSCGTAAYRRQRVVVEDIAVDPLWAGLTETALRHGLRACWSQPIFSTAGNVLGTFAMYYCQPRSPSPQELRLIEDAAHLAGMVIERKRAEEALLESERHFREVAERNLRLVREVEHRVRNNLAGLLALVSLLEENASDVPGFAAALRGRLTAMTHVHQMLSEAGWQAVNLRVLASSSLRSMDHLAGHPGRVTLEGPDVSVSPQQAQALAMVLAEWFTNSCKYGSRSVAGGEFSVRWQTRAEESRTVVRLTWTERGGPTIQTPGVPSLGTALVRGLVANELRGRCTLGFPSEGAEHVIEFPL